MPPLQRWALIFAAMLLAACSGAGSNRAENPSVLERHDDGAAEAYVVNDSHCQADYLQSLAADQRRDELASACLRRGEFRPSAAQTY